MSKTIKIPLITALMVLIIFAAFAEQVPFPGWLDRITLTLYLRLVALLCLVIAAFNAWGYRRRVEASQRYQRSQEVLAQAEVSAQRKQDALQQKEAKLETQYGEKERLLREELETIKAGYLDQIKSLKEQNTKLKEAVNQLMQAVKTKKASAE